MNTLIHRLAREISYPLSTPVVTCTSQNYYRTYPYLNLICVPLGESRFLLHLPDLYHELAHPLLASSGDPKIQPFQQSCASFLNTAQEYIAGQLEVERTGQRPDAFRMYLLTWLQCWESWAVELFCDLFATYVLGPAFAWSHFHLSATRGTDPCRAPTFTPTTHPPDHARMEVILRALQILSFQNEATSIRQWWNDYLSALRVSPSPEFLRCFPNDLLDQAAILAVDGARAIGCAPASPSPTGQIRAALHEAWLQFWSSPTGYVQWEAETVEAIFR